MLLHQAAVLSEALVRRLPGCPGACSLLMHNILEGSEEGAEADEEATLAAERAGGQAGAAWMRCGPRE